MIGIPCGRLFAAALAVFACGGAAAGWVDDPDAPGRAASVSFRPMASGTAVAVRPLDDSPLNLKIAARMTQALRERGLSVTDKATLLLEFETATESAASPLPRGAAVEPRRVDIGRERDLGRSDAVDARVDVYSNARSSLLTGVRRPDTDLRYVLRATLADRAGGPRIWEGWSEYGALASDDERIYAAMAVILAGMIGQTTEQRFSAE